MALPTSVESVFAQSMAAGIFLAESNIPAITSSFTAFAFAPGVLKTTIPFSAHFSSGILLTPAPALAIASRLSGNSISCISWLLTITPVVPSISSVIVYLSVKRASPTGEILFRVVILYILLPPYKFSLELTSKSISFVNFTFNMADDIINLYFIFRF